MSWCLGIVVLTFEYWIFELNWIIRFCFWIFHVIVSGSRRRRDNTDASVGPHTEKFNIVSNNHGCTHKCDISVFDRKYSFWAILIKKKKKKTVIVSWNLVPRLIWICRIQWGCSLFPLLTGNTLFGQTWLKKSKLSV